MSDHDHYFTADPVSTAQQRSLSVQLAGRDVTVRTASGIFSPDSIDKGTAVLLREAPAPPTTGALLDLGCGWGPITLTLALRSPEATVYGVDVNARALDLLRTTAASLDLDTVHACRPEDVPPDVEFAAIWSNPPIRVGKAALHDMLLTWLPRLEVGGAAYLVVQKNLGSDSLQKWLGDHLPAEAFTVGRFALEKGFRLLEVRRTA